MDRISAGAAIAASTDPGSFRPWDGTSGELPDVPGGHVDASTHADEAIRAGEAWVGGVRVAVLAWEFAHLGGSVGVGTAARVVAAVRRATSERLPLVSVPRSGGTRMQEGAPAFVQMVAIAAALAEHRAAGLPHLVHLGGPTMGGVLATLGSAGDLTTAEPGARIGFLGPRAFTAITGETFPEGIQTAENLARLGILDDVLPWSAVRQRWATVLSLWADRPQAGATDLPNQAVVAAPASQTPTVLAGAPDSAAQLWEYVLLSREQGRVDAAQFLAEHLTDVVVLPGTAQGDVAQGATVALGRLAGLPVVVAATTDRRGGEPLTVGGLRTIRRGIALAGRWGLPMVTVVDTLGAQLSVEGEESGIAGEISRVMLDLVAVRVPTVALLLGAGTGGAALALLATDRIVAGSHTWVSPLAPEGAAVIRHGGTHDPAQIAWEQRIGAHALAGLGFIDHVVRESDPGWVATAAAEVGTCLRQVIAGEDPRRRFERFDAWLT